MANNVVFLRFYSSGDLLVLTVFLIFPAVLPLLTVLCSFNLFKTRRAGVSGLLFLLFLIFLLKQGLKQASFAPQTLKKQA